MAGVALAGASAITFAAVPALPGERVVATPAAVVEQTHNVALTGFAEVLTSVVTAIQESGNALVNTSPALYWQVHEQWPDPELLPWNYALFTDIFLAPIAPLIVGPVNDAVAAAFAEVFPGQSDFILRVPELIEYAVVRAIGPILSAIGGAGAAHEQIYESMTTYEIAPFIEAIIAAPGHVIDGFLNGGYGDLRPLLTGEVGGDPIPAPGLLTPWGAEPVQRYADDNASLVDFGTEEETTEGRPATTVTAPAQRAAEASLVAETSEQTADDPTEARTGLRENLRELRTSVREGVTRSTGVSSTDDGGGAVADRGTANIGRSTKASKTGDESGSGAAASKSGVERKSSTDDAA
ncbi:hypothetical protein A5757_14740 [Mycobacterium sp. 852013-51886_SCH5428379]|uniref:hypothetical protein n=1 Tax=Mycobacterium sp. 852013-51886_SCH5428379 TaxID=1834111 RepID=UPI0008005081|nr:hypothetical protein [Mycobacterium sp. 852013-51886_SCH5428379]OBB59212.1 hypothetical protein A5757_14740 [Mycobacterium sp. 852013-51886_SCH5428379]